jgi:circadian clock protein KaiC
MMATGRISSGIKNMDSLLGGGFLKDNVIIYHGSPGTGKTISSLFFALDGLKKCENVLYVSFEEGESDLIRLAKNVGIDFSPYLRNNQFKIKDFSKRISDSGLETGIMERIRDAKINRVVIDSLTTAIIDHAIDGSDLRVKRLIRNLIKTLRELNATTIIISRDELEYETAVSLADCAIYFEPHVMGDKGLSSCTITKFRFSRHDKKVQYLDLTKPGQISVRVEK